jgi:aminoglycoside phosphotransferase (APT) family kinase protein
MAIDQARAVRPEETLDEATLSAYLTEQLDGFAGPLSVQQFPSGYSNLTYLLATPQREYVLRRPPLGPYAPRAHDMQREYRVLSLLKPVYDAVPRPLHYCDDPSVIDAPFYVMERVRGVILRRSAPDGIELTPALMRRVSEAAVDQLADLHALDTTATGLADLGKPEGYTQRQVSGWAERYRRSATDAVPAMDEAADWLAANVPSAPTRAAFIHNDYKYDNLVLDPADLTRITAVLDWEMATVGDPLMDLGTTLGYWAEEGDPLALKPFNLTWWPGNLTRQQVVERYAERSGLETSNIVFYYVFGCFKIGVIVQQIYARYRQGHTQDPRFAGLIHVVQACASNAQRAISLNRISNLS